VDLCEETPRHVHESSSDGSTREPSPNVLRDGGVYRGNVDWCRYCDSFHPLGELEEDHKGTLCRDREACWERARARRKRHDQLDLAQPRRDRDAAGRAR